MDASNKSEKSPGYYAELKVVILRDHMLYDSICMTFRNDKISETVVARS